MVLERKCPGKDDWETTSPDVVITLAMPKFNYTMGHPDTVLQSVSLNQHRPKFAMTTSEDVVFRSASLSHLLLKAFTRYFQENISLLSFTE